MKILGLASQTLRSVLRLLELSAQLVDLGGVGTRVALGALKLGLQVGYLALPLVDHLVERPLSLLGLRRRRLRLKSHATNCSFDSDHSLLTFSRSKMSVFFLTVHYISHKIAQNTTN